MKNRNLLFLAGRSFSPLYSLLMKLRASMYRVGVLRVARLDVPVISVGNLTLGGTGKTPVVQYLARLLKNWGWSPAVVSRGYGGSSKEKVNIVSTGKQPLLEAAYVGDEPRFLAETLDGISVLTGPARKYPARKAVEIGADVLILDDGFQHMALERTIDLVLFNADSLAGNSRVFPGGDLREPVNALKRCDGFIMTGVCERNRERAERFADLLSSRFPGRPVFQARYKATAVIEYKNDGSQTALSGESVKNLSFFGFSGIAHPERFQQTLEDMGLNVKSFKVFPDHFLYKQKNMQSLCNLAEQAGANALVTTEKDMVKLYGLRKAMPLYTVRMEAVFDEAFHDYLQAGLQIKSTTE